MAPRRPKMTDSEKVAAKLAANRRGRVTLIKARNLQPTVVTAIRRQNELTVFVPSDLDTLKIDRTYQRPENRVLVNQLVAVLEAGGTVPDPITVAVRPNGDKYIVDGQQRWAAHYLSGKPLAAVLYFVKDEQEERRLFTVLNASKRPSAAIRMRAWAGPVSELLKWLQEDMGSPMYGQISYGTAGGNNRFVAPTFLRGLAGAWGSTHLEGNTEDFMRQLDQVWSGDRARCRRIAVQFAQLLKAVFPNGRLRSLSALALGQACGVRWDKEQSAFTQPTKAALYQLTRMNWTNVPMNQESMWLPTLKAEILRRWKGGK